MDKAEKLKAARKKLKEFQSHKTGPSQTASTELMQGVMEQPPIESVDAFKTEYNSQPLSTFDNVFDSITQNQAPSQAQNNNNSLPPSSEALASYFGGDNGSAFDIPFQTVQTDKVQEFSFFSTPLENTTNIPSETSFQPPPALPQQFSVIPESSRIFETSTSTPAAFQLAQPDQYPSSNDKMSELQRQLEEQNHQISQLKSELEFHRQTAANLQKNADELTRLRHETQSHVDVVKVLVSEKSNLIDTVHKLELETKAKTDENDELHNRLNLSRNRVKQLEAEAKNNVVKTVQDSTFDSKKIEEIIDAQTKELKDSKEKIEVEKNELKILLNQKRIELNNLQNNFDHINNELQLANVKITQLSEGTVPADDTNKQIEELKHDVARKQELISQYLSFLDEVGQEKDQSERTYQEYVTHMNNDLQSLRERNGELSEENNALVKREKELLQHVSDLERQIQLQMQKQKTYAENNSSLPQHEELQKLSSQIAELTESNETLKSQLAKAESEKVELHQTLELKLEELKNMELTMERLQTETPNLSQLMTDFEDKSVAASRALSQNQGLKEQLDEMQRAFITMTNDKMELTDKLQSEMHLCKEMKIRYDAMEIELQAMKDKWHYKEDEMIRLSHENTELEKKIFQQNIEIDRLRHYESKEYHGGEGIIESELENAKRMIETLTNKISILESQGKHEHENESEHDHSHEGHNGHGHSHSPGHSHSHSHNHIHESGGDEHQCETKDSTKHLLDEIELLKMEKRELLKAMNDFQKKVKEPVEKTSEDTELPSTNSPEEPVSEMNEETMQKLTVTSVTPSIATQEALEKLQARFRRTMLEVADLTEEKQRLEHVVTQLQFETETIGEYITLYQFQRRMLKQKEYERDIQLKNLAADREKMNEKLLQLNSLIEKFVLQHNDGEDIAKEATKFLEKDPLNDLSSLTKSHIAQSEDISKLKQETAGKILEILSEIKTVNSSTYDANIGVENCSCCLGKLETV